MPRLEAMADLGTFGSHQDRLSSLPDEFLLTILSFLPTRIAARTSLLSTRFRSLWQHSPSLDLICEPNKPQSFTAMANSTLLHRQQPLLRLYLDSQCYKDALFISKLLNSARDLGLRHLHMEAGILGLTYTPFIWDLLHAIFIPTLRSLSLHTFYYYNFEYPLKAPLTQLTSLSLGLSNIDPAKFQQFISSLCSLVDLDVKVHSMETLRISSKTIRKLKLKLGSGFNHLETVMLSLPFLEFLHLESFFGEHWPSQFHGEIPLLRKAALTLNGLGKKICGGVPGLISYLSHVEELNFHVKEPMYEKTPFPTLLEPRREAPNFPNLKHLEATMCFHEHNFEAVVSMLRHSPTLQSVKLVHEPHKTYIRLRRRKVWASKLPRNADGNYRYAHLINLHLGENSKQFGKLLNKKCTPKN